MVPPIAEDGSDTANAAYGDATANTPALDAATKAAALPREVRDARLAAYGQRLYASIAAAAPGATWVMQGWLFGADKKFWTPDAIAAFLRDVPDEKMLILDIGNDRYPGIWKTTNGFDGKSWFTAMSIIMAAATRFTARRISTVAMWPHCSPTRGAGMCAASACFRRDCTITA